MNECPNIGMSDSEGHESDNAAIQVMTTDTEFMKLMKGKNGTTSFLPNKKRVDR